MRRVPLAPACGDDGVDGEYLPLDRYAARNRKPNLYGEPVPAPVRFEETRYEDMFKRFYILPSDALEIAAGWNLTVYTSALRALRLHEQLVEKRRIEIETNITFNEEFVEKPLKSLREQRAEAFKEFSGIRDKAKQNLREEQSRWDRKADEGGNGSSVRFPLPIGVIAAAEGERSPQPKAKVSAYDVIDWVTRFVYGASLGWSILSYSGSVSLDSIESSSPFYIVAGAVFGFLGVNWAGALVQSLGKKASEARVLMKGDPAKKADYVWNLRLGILVMVAAVFAETVMTGTAFLKLAALDMQTDALGGTNTGDRASLAWIYLGYSVFFAFYLGWKFVQGWLDDGSAVANWLAHKARAAESSTEVRLEQELAEAEKKLAEVDRAFAKKESDLVQLRKPTDGSLTDEDEKLYHSAYADAAGAYSEWKKAARPFIRKTGLPRWFGVLR